MVVLILVSILAVLVKFWYWQYYRYEKHLKNLKGPPMLPLLGNALEYRTLEDLLPNWVKSQEEYGGISKNVIGFRPHFLVISDIKFVEFLLSSNQILSKSENYNFLLRWLGTGLLTGAGPKWKKYRKIITPAFHFQILEQFVDTFDAFSNTLVEKLRKEVGKESTDIYPYITLCSLDIICATSMGTTVNAQEDSGSDYLHSVKEMCRIIIERATSVFKMYESLYCLSRDYQKEKRALKVLHGYTYSVIRSRQKQLETNEEDRNCGEDDTGIKRKKTLLDSLLQYNRDGEPITDEEIREQVDTFMFAGHDTTASAMSFALYCIATHADVQAKAVEELNDIFGDDKRRPATYRDLQQMKYLEAVIKESLRLYPSVPFYGRNVDENFEYDGVTYPKRATLIIFAYGIHRLPEIYPDPERFDPERFISGNQAERSLYAYIPFSAGVRNCIGQKFAMLEIKAVVSKVLRHYELLPTVPVHKLLLVPETVLKSKNGICMRLRNRSS